MENIHMKTDEMHGEQTHEACEENRILARKVARELTIEEIDQVSGGMAIRTAGTSFSGPCCHADDCCMC
jgi:hypothetical protein